MRVDLYILRELQIPDSEPVVIAIWCDGEQLRSYCFVADAVEAVCRMMHAPEPLVGPLNVGSDRSVRVKDLLDIVSRQAEAHAEKLPQTSSYSGSVSSSGVGAAGSSTAEAAASSASAPSSFTLPALTSSSTAPGSSSPASSSSAAAASASSSDAPCASVVSAASPAVTSSSAALSSSGDIASATASSGSEPTGSTDSNSSSSLRLFRPRFTSGPEGVRARNSDNTRVSRQLAWAPRVSLEVGIARTYAWIYEQVRSGGSTLAQLRAFTTSHIVQQRMKAGEAASIEKESSSEQQ